MTRLAVSLSLILVTKAQFAAAADGAKTWQDRILAVPYAAATYPDHMVLELIRQDYARYPFSFTYDGKSSDELLPTWTRHEHSIAARCRPEQTNDRLDGREDRAEGTLGRRAICRFSRGRMGAPLRERGEAPTRGSIENVRAMDLTVSSPLNFLAPYTLHSAKGGVPNPSQSMPKTCVIDEKTPATLGSETGRSSTKNLPFFRLDAGGETYVAAIGWSGCWQADFVANDSKRLHITSGMEKTHFLLHPGEKVRSPRILLLRWEGEAIESNSQFRQLIYKHYAAKRNGKPPLPAIFCNTCFTRGGGWLNECNAENQISLIHAYAPLGLEALLTDAGWFTGGWPNGAGNWDARKDAYPSGMGPVAKAALDHNMIYGLWYEPERVVAGTGIHKQHPEWCLHAGPGPQSTFLLNFGLPEVQQYFFHIVQSYMDLPGFRVYRQDFNMDPLPYWRQTMLPTGRGSRK